MKNLIKYASIAMIVIAAWKLPFEIYVVFRNGFSGPGMFTVSFASHVFMIITGIMGLKFRDEGERQKMLAGISGMQLMLCQYLVTVFRFLYGQPSRIPTSLIGCRSFARSSFLSTISEERLGLRRKIRNWYNYISDI